MPGDAQASVSFAQWRLWFLEQLQPGTHVWNTPVAARLRGPLDIDALRAALELILTRHRALRTVFRAQQMTPVPTLLSATGHDVLRVHDAAAEDPDGERFVTVEARRPFDISSEPLLRAALLRVGADEHILVLVAHHIACDGWSKGIIVRDLATAYDALAEGRQPELPSLALEFSDHATWERQWLSGERLAELTAHWSDRLADLPEPPLRTDLTRPPMPRFRGAVEWMSVGTPDVAALLGIGREERATPFMTVLAAFNVFVNARSLQEDLLVGAPVAMRDRPGLADVVGLFVNTLPYRTDMSGAPSFRAAVRRVRAVAIDAYEHQYLPFDKIVEAARPERAAGHNPLVQLNLRLEGAEPALELSGLVAEPLRVDPGIARFDLAVELSTSADGLAGYLEYDTDLFLPATAAALAADFVSVIRAVAADPDAAVATLDAVREIRRRV